MKPPLHGVDLKLSGHFATIIMSYYSEDEEQVEFRRVRRDVPPPPRGHIPQFHYVEAPGRRERPQSRAYYNNPDVFLAPERTMVTTRQVHRERSRERRSSPTAATPSQVPIIINNVQGHHSSDDDSSIASSYHHRRGRSGSVAISHAHSRSHSRADSRDYMSMEQYQLERRLEDTRRELELLRMTQPHNEKERHELERDRDRLREQRDQDQRRLMMKDYEIGQLRRAQEHEALEDLEEERLTRQIKERELHDLKAAREHEERVRRQDEQHRKDMEEFELRRSRDELKRLKELQQQEKEAHEKAKEAKTQAELRAAKDELDKINKAKEEQAERQRLRKEFELQQLMEKEKAEKERKEREAFEKAAVEKWQREQAEKAAKAKKDKEEAEKELRRQMRDRLLASGYPEHEIQAILDGKRAMPPPHHRPLPPHGHGLPPPPPMHPHPLHQGHGALVHGHAGPSTEITTTKTTYTRMARKHLSIEALRERAIEYEFDAVRVNFPLYYPSPFPSPPSLGVVPTTFKSPPFPQKVFLHAHSSNTCPNHTEPRLHPHQTLGSPRGAKRTLVPDQIHPQRPRKGNHDARH